MVAVLPLGSGPRDEHPPTDGAAAYRACTAYRLAFRVLLGNEPGGAALRVVRSPGDGDAPFTLICEFDPTDADAARYAEACRRTDIDTWAAAGPTAPSAGPGRGV